jgi:outer membrane protein TolC
MRPHPIVLVPVLVAAAASRLAAEPPPLSFADAVAAARSRNESLLAARAEERQRQDERKAAKGLYFPTVSFVPLYTHLNEEILLDLDPIRDVVLKLHPQVPPALVPPFEETLFKQDMLRLPLTARWPLFTGGRIRAANRAAEARVQDASAQARMAEEGVTRALVRAYFGLRLALADKAVRTDVLDGLERHVADARRLEEEGLIAKAERLSAEVARAEADRQLRRAAHDVEIARSALANVLAVDGDPGDPVTPLFVLGGLEPVERFREAALASHPALARLAAQQALAGEAVAAEKGSLWPEVFAYGLYETRKADLSPIEPEWMAGVGARVELFDGGARLRKVAAARAQQDRVAHLDRKLRRDLGTLVERHYREAEKAREQWQALEAARELADESLRARSRAFEEGLGTSLEVVDARLAQQKVRLERLAAAHAFVNALAELLEASGQGERFEEMRATGSAIEVQP